MNIPAIELNERQVRIVRDILLQYELNDDAWNTVGKSYAEVIARHIVKNLKKNKMLKTY